MSESEKSAEEVILESYLPKLDTLRNKMIFNSFVNKKFYSFDYHLKSEFDVLMEELNKELEQNKLTLSPAISNRIPVFLPKETRRIAFFSYPSKSVREVKIDELESILTKLAEKQSRINRDSTIDIKKIVQEDLDVFDSYHAKHNFQAYRRDITTTTIQFNAYDDKDNLLLEKAFVRGGLVFDMAPKDFSSQIEISYPRRRKQRSDKKDSYLPLKLIKIRGIQPPKTDQNSIISSSS